MNGPRQPWSSALSRAPRCRSSRFRAGTPRSEWWRASRAAARPPTPSTSGWRASLPPGRPSIAGERCSRRSRASGIRPPRQVHQTAVRWHEGGDGLTVLSGFDGHASSTPGLMMAISLADCIPIYLVDPIRRAAALLHAGWRGTAGGILEEGVRILVSEARSRPGDLRVHFGVGICGPCYEVGSEVLAACGRPIPETGKGRCDLREVLAEQAVGLGIGKISTSTRCSAHQNDLFFSHRASLGQDGRMVAYLGLAP
ncbi:MAG: polyphenol oxidase family protein [Gemmatimonadales bacterium]